MNETACTEKIEFLFEDGQCFPQCHASSLIKMENGDILSVYFAGTHEKADDVGIWLSRRTQDGWETPVCLAKVENVAHWNPVILNSGRGTRVLQGWKNHSRMAHVAHGIL